MNPSTQLSIRGRFRIYESAQERRIYHNELARYKRRLRKYLELKQYLLDSPFPQIVLQVLENEGILE